MAELTSEISVEIKRLCLEGDELAERSSFPEAIDLYWSAWDLLPEPQTDWEAATWILAAIGDANFHSADFHAGADNLSFAMRCPDAIGNPFIHLRLGQCQFELGSKARAQEELARALTGGGKELFDDEDPKYFTFITSILKPPRGEW